MPSSSAAANAASGGQYEWKRSRFSPCALATANDALPLGDFRRRMAGLGENAAFQRAADEGLAAVDGELRALNSQVADTEGHIPPVKDRAVIRLLDPNFQRIDVGVKLIPQIKGLIERQFRFHRGAAGRNVGSDDLLHDGRCCCDLRDNARTEPELDANAAARLVADRDGYTSALLAGNRKHLQSSAIHSGPVARRLRSPTIPFQFP